MTEPLGERRKSLEEEFFARQNAELVGKLRVERERAEIRALMAEASGIDDADALDRLIDQGVTPATVAALSLAPLVAVAWADRKLEDKERKAVLDGAADAGVRSGTAAYELLEGWLNQAPPASLMQTWSDYTRAIAAGLTSEQRRELRETLVGRARKVGEAAGGGFAGMGSKLSDAEQATLRDIEAALAD